MSLSIIKLALLALLIQYASAKGVSANVSSLCAKTCDWTNAAIWDDGVVPTSADTVDIQVGGTYTIQISTAVSIKDFDMGSDKSPSGTQLLQVLNGGSFTSTGGFNIAHDSNIQVDAGGSLYVAGQGLVRGKFTVAGFAHFAGSSPSLSLDTYNLQVSVSWVYATLELNGGVVKADNAVELTSTATLKGNGDINGTLNAYGNVEPGLNTIGVLNVWGDFVCNLATDVTIEIKDKSTFDRIWVGKTLKQSGSLYATTLGDYEPLSHSIYVVFNTTEQQGGFDNVKGTSLKSYFNDKWTVKVSQDYTALLYDSASSVLISVATIVACLIVTLM